MATKTWKLGEVCKGGIITVETSGKTITVIGKEWDNSAGYTRKTNQSNAKEWCRQSFRTESREVRRDLDNYLCDLTTYGYASKIIEWIESKVKLGNEFQY